jgi:hypothetical protein
MIDLLTIRDALKKLDIIDGDNSVSYIESAIESLETASEALNTIGVRGRANVDALYGLMIALDMVIGGKDKPGKGG